QTCALPISVDRGLGRAQEVRHRHTGDLDRVLHGEEEAGAGTLVDLHLQEVLAVEQHLTLGHLVGRVAGQRVGERRLARPVGAHDRVDLAAVDGEVDALEDRLRTVRGRHGGVEVLVLELGHLRGSSLPVSRVQALAPTVTVISTRTVSPSTETAKTGTSWVAGRLSG